jgi:hypothetical protein
MPSDLSVCGALVTSIALAVYVPMLGIQWE